MHSGNLGQEEGSSAIELMHTSSFVSPKSLAYKQDDLARDLHGAKDGAIRRRLP